MNFFVSCARLYHGDFLHLLIASDCRPKCDRHYTRLYNEAEGLEAKDPNSKWFCISAVLILLFLSLLYFIQCVHLPLLLLHHKIQRSVLHAWHLVRMLFRHLRWTRPAVMRNGSRCLSPTRSSRWGLSKDSRSTPASGRVSSTKKRVSCHRAVRPPGATRINTSEGMGDRVSVASGRHDFVRSSIG